VAMALQVLNILRGKGQSSDRQLYNVASTVDVAERYTEWSVSVPLICSLLRRTHNGWGPVQV
jgi:hypothetical protein